MKNLFILFSFYLLIFSSCSKKGMESFIHKKSPIIDYNNSDEFYKNSGKVKYIIDKQKAETIIIVNDKVVEYQTFRKLLDNNQIIAIETIEDSKEISKLNYSYDKVKKIIIAHTK